MVNNMKFKKHLYIIMFLLIIGLTSADLCEHEIEPNTECQIVTPNLDCTSYTYEVFYNNGTSYDSGTLEIFQGSLYYFNFTASSGEYVIELCDESTTQVIIKEDEAKMSFLGTITLLPLIIAFLFIFGAGYLSDKHSILRFLSYMFILPLSWVSFHFGMIGIVKYLNLTELQIAIGDTTYWMGWIFFALIFYWFVYLIKTAFDTSAQRKKEQLEY